MTDREDSFYMAGRGRVNVRLGLSLPFNLSHTLPVPYLADVPRDYRKVFEHFTDDYRLFVFLFALKELSADRRASKILVEELADVRFFVFLWLRL